ncbi:hypothetical protein CCAX7_001320 [Capsulimonas corticalis]|uniref:Uncharacterized protein n=1 Tax=Capsulimonas corticalis TaxID=2219043 RepID=A0A402CRP9_9BACT|nr:hypothetical protein [Capsulimonas corticalis]BDI28081.1 hypothetical protein CCAX7_001320 [Capsulimonas corticalis]
MKLRIRGNSVRLRLDRREIAALGLGDTVEERTEFGPSPEHTLRCTVVAREQDTPLAAAFTQNQIAIFIRQEDAATLVNTETVGVEAAQEIGDGRSLRLLLEKDFACLQDRVGEDDTHSFDNPSACSP